jgi:hypothetical protein
MSQSSQKKLRSAWLLSPLLWIGMSMAHASPVFTDAELVTMLKAEGYSAVEKIESGAVKVKIDGVSYVLFNKEDGDLQAYYGATGLKVSLNTMNEWNKSHRLSRAYLDSDNDPVLESDLMSDGGMTKGNVLAFFKVFVLSVKQYRDTIMSSKADH